MEIRIRPMVPEDWDAAAEIYMQGIRSNMATYERELPGYEAWDAAHLNQCRLVAETAGELAGWVALLPFSPRKCFSGVAELSIYIDGGHRRQGVGEALLRELISRAESLGFWSLQSVIFPENIPSLRLHEKCGFRKIGVQERLARDHCGKWRDVVLMEYRRQDDRDD